MIPDRSDRFNPVVRDRLFAAATAAFVQHGYERASLNAILAAAGMGKSSFFYYFLDKEDLFASTLEAALARIAEAAGPVAPPTNPAEILGRGHRGCWTLGSCCGRGAWLRGTSASISADASRCESKALANHG